MAVKDVLVCGTLNLEITLPIGSFPLDYEPVHYHRFKLNSNPSGVGFNVSRALSVLGNRVRFVSMIGPDSLGTCLRSALSSFEISDEFVLPTLSETPQSIVMFDNVGRRMVHTDLKDIGERDYPLDYFEKAAHGEHFAIMTNAAFSRPLLPKIKPTGASVATDLQTASEASRAYDADFLQFAEILFLSHEKLHEEPEKFVSTLWDRTSASIVVVGMGASGAMLCMRCQKSQCVSVR